MVYHNLFRVVTIANSTLVEVNGGLMHLLSGLLVTPSLTIDFAARCGSRILRIPACRETLPHDVPLPRRCKLDKQTWLPLSKDDRDEQDQ